MKVGVVIPCINLWAKYTKPAITSVTRSMMFATKRGIESELLVIDNASTDETHDQMLTVIWPDVAEGSVTYLRNEIMWGFQKSANYGVNHFLNMGYDYVLVLNNDITLHEDAIWRLVERFRAGGVSMVTAMDVRGEIDAAQLSPVQINMLTSEEKREKVPESDHPHFSAFMVSKECWKEVGELDEIFEPAYYEDNDYHHRMKLLGLRAVTYPAAMFYHFGSRTQNEALGRPLTHSSNQHAYYVRKWGGDPGKETFTIPHNDQHKTIKSVKQMS